MDTINANANSITCAICDAKRIELREQKLRKIQDLWDGFHKEMIALAEAHAEGKHKGLLLVGASKEQWERALESRVGNWGDAALLEVEKI